MTDDARAGLLEAVRSYHKAVEVEERFVPGVTPLLTGGAVLDADDRVALVGAALDLRIVAGGHTTAFEREFARALGLRKAHLTNSGSSANLLAVTALTSPQLGDRRLRPGDEVVTVAAGFPTTVNPILQNGLVPVFVDVELGTYNTTPERIAAAIGPKTRALVLAHTLGNPYAAEEIAALAREHRLWFVEDNCDGLDSTYRGRLTGTFGDLSTCSFYPAHHITTGEGGAVTTNNVRLARIVESIRDWGRDCWCAPGDDDTCRRRFEWTMGTLPPGYDHKYTYSHIGFNLKTTDLQAALGSTQLRKLSDLSKARRRNWQRLREGLDAAPWLILPRATEDSDPSWFGFVLTIAPDAPFERRDMIAFLESRRIATRLLFGGNLTRHPAYHGATYRIADDLTNSDIITEHTFWVGVHPRLTDEMVDYLADSIREFVTADGRW
jgi:dTDP-4-dehydro-2,6-dideoxy-D-glucose 3-dehydratase